MFFLQALGFFIVSLFPLQASAKQEAEMFRGYSELLFGPNEISGGLSFDARVAYQGTCRLPETLTTSFKAYVEKKFGIDTTRLQSLNGSIEHVVQYLNRDGKDIQISATREHSSAIAYRIDAFTASVGGRFSRVQLPNIKQGHVYAIESFLPLIENSNSNDLFGARVLTVRARAKDGSGEQATLKFINHFPISFESSQIVCKYDFDDKVFQCGCPLPDEHSTHNTKQPENDRQETRLTAPRTAQEIYFTASTKTYLKASTATSESLPANSKCLLNAEEKVKLKKVPQGVSGKHFSVELLETKNGCKLTKGFVYGPHVVFEGFNPPAYVFPLPNGVYTSQWCVCRSVGSSPHIGQDIGIRGSNQSVALSDVIVEDVIFSETCGYSVSLRDGGNAKWRYLHLNKPLVKVGQRLASGQKIGTHANYPSADCGTGPHLHLERLAPGMFADNEKIKQCDSSGAKTCNYDPILPFRSFQMVRTAPVLASTLPESVSCSPSQPETVESEILNQKAEKSASEVRLNLTKQKYLQLSHSLSGLKNWRLLVSRQGKRVDEKPLLIASGNAYHNSKAQLSAESRFCLPTNAGDDFVIEYETKTGQWLQSTGKITRE